MLNKKEILNILESYNINSNKYGPTIFENDNNIGICLEIKDSLFGFLTRYFTFNTKTDFEDFLKKYSWHKNNKNKYSITLKLNNYETKTPELEYLYQGKSLTLNEMFNIENIKIETKEIPTNDIKKDFYLKSIDELTNYLIDLKKDKINNIKEKNSLKTEENDLKHNLIEYLSTYYGKKESITKKAITLEIITNNSDISSLKENKNNLKNKNLDEIKDYLELLINLIKEEELNEKNLINIYSNKVYKYNISILKKQIEFVKNKIAAEKNFNVKGSNVHNIDAELKSFLNHAEKPESVLEFLNNIKLDINNKFLNINCDNACLELCHKKIKETKKTIAKNCSKEEIIKNLDFEFDSLDSETKAHLVLYNSLYRDICNYIIKNDYPALENIKESFNWDYYYTELQDIIYNENNIHYLVKYFNYLNFKTLETYINSIIKICKTIESTRINPLNKLELFYIEDHNNYKSLTLNPIYDTNNKIYITSINETNNIIYIPDKIKIDEKTKEICTLATKNIYIKCNIEETLDTKKVVKYKPIQKKDKKNNIIITTDLVKYKENIFSEGNIKEEIND